MDKGDKLYQVDCITNISFNYKSDLEYKKEENKRIKEMIQKKKNEIKLLEKSLYN